MVLAGSARTCVVSPTTTKLSSATVIRCQNIPPCCWFLLDRQEHAPKTNKKPDLARFFLAGHRRAGVSPVNTWNKHKQRLSPRISPCRTSSWQWEARTVSGMWLRSLTDVAGGDGWGPRSLWVGTSLCRWSPQTQVLIQQSREYFVFS